MKKRMIHLACGAVLGLIAASCSTQRMVSDNELMTIHIVDRNGLKETVSSKDRLTLYCNNDFLSSQPYQRVTRIYCPNTEGKTTSKITSYHDNGEISEYLELVNGRACGAYRSWHPNGQLNVEAFVVEGMGDLSVEAQKTWVFDGTSRARNAQGNLLAEIYYEKGVLQGNALYYHANGQVSRIVPYEKGEIEGDLLLYNGKGDLLGKTSYSKGKKHGAASFKGDEHIPPYSENYQHDLLMNAMYFDFSGNTIARIEQGAGTKVIFKEGRLTQKCNYQGGIEEGLVRCFDQWGHLASSFEIKDGVKEGEEWVYYLPIDGESMRPKLYLQWHEGVVHGVCRTWYENGALESEREIYENKKHGIASAWYPDGSMMFIEEYDHNLLKSGSYRKKSNSEPISFVENGKGVATLYDAKGLFIKEIHYDQGKPLTPR